MKGISVTNVSKSFKKNLALDDINFHLEPNRIYGLLGRNGAGKSTLIKIMTNRIFCDTGSITIDGIPCMEQDSMHEKVFFISDANLFPNMKIKQLYQYLNDFYDAFDHEKAMALTNAFSLDISKKMLSLSTGYRSIAKLIIALSLRIPYVIYDEPVLGLDANHRELFYKYLLESFEEYENTIIIATHLIEEVSNLIDSVILIDEGKLLLFEQVETLKQSGYSIAGKKEDIALYCAGKEVLDMDVIGDMHIAYMRGAIDTEKLHSHLIVSPLNLQKLFIKLTERK